MTWFKRESSELDSSGEKRVRTEGLWEKCEGCRQIIWKKDLDANLNVCPKCDQHFRLDARARLAMLLDNSEWEETETNLSEPQPITPPGQSATLVTSHKQVAEALVKYHNLQEGIWGAVHSVWTSSIKRRAR